MKIQANYNQLNGLNKSVSFSSADKAKKVLRYIPKDYLGSRTLSEKIYENTHGPRKILMRLQKHSGENMNNIVTAVGTTGIAPFFIAFNPMSKEDSKSKQYTAWRQPVSALITLGTQLFVMKNFNKWIDKHAVDLGVEEIDLSAKPPESVLKAQAKRDYPAYLAECEKNKIDPISKDKYIKHRITELQDEAFYKKLNELRSNLDIDKLSTKDLLRLDDLKDTRNDLFKKIFEDKYHFSKEEIEEFKDFERFVKKGESICKKKNLNYATVIDEIEIAVQNKLIPDIERLLKEETAVKLQTSLLKTDMSNKLNEQTKVIKEQFVNESESFIHQKIQEAQKAIYDAELSKLKPKYQQILEIENEVQFEGLTDEQRMIKHVYQKLFKNKSKNVNNPIDSLRCHGVNEKEVYRSVFIKKYLKNIINRSEAKLKSWKDRSGMLVGLAILPITCSILNWAYPKFMDRFHPELSAAKAESVKKKNEALWASSNEVKEAK